jgi:outer membrane receptor for ferrienterochelin and colicin
VAAFRVATSVLLALCAIAQFAEAAIALRGVVRDSSGAPVGGAAVVLATSERSSITVAHCDPQGQFTLDAPAPGNYLLIVTAPGFQELRRSVRASETSSASIDITLSVGNLSEEVTVTAAPTLAQDVRIAGQPVNVIGAFEIQERVKTVVAEAVEGETGVQLQRTSPTMAGLFVRGLTGNKVNVFLDGIRYSNGAQRGGVNTFLDLIEPESLESIEVLRGPSSAQYGSDALGGSVQFLTRVPTLAVGGQPDWSGSFAVSGSTGHSQGGAEAFGAYKGPNLGLTFSGAGRSTGRIRPGGGIDSHAAIARFFGVRSDVLMDHRLPETGFAQGGGSVRAHWGLAPDTRIVASYSRTHQDGGDRYDQLLGGDGNLIAELNDLSLDFASVRLERLGMRFADHLSLTYSLNSQREERVNQGGNGNPAATIGHEPERTTANGVQAIATKQISPRQSVTAGGDVYFESVSSVAFNVNPTTGVVSPRRPRVPDEASFTQGGAFVQTAIDLLPERLRAIGAFRYGGVAYRASASDSAVVNGAPLWPDDSLNAASPTFRASVVATPDQAWTFFGSVSRGFRAPHITDLGTLGLTGSGFEVAAPDVEGLGAFVGSTADAEAISTGSPVEQVTAETSLQFEASAAYRHARWRADLTWFVNTIDGNIQKQALILPAGAVGATLGGQPIVAQTANGAVFVPAAPTTPVLVRANFDRARIWGLEHTGQFMVANPLSIRTVFTYLRARDTNTDLPPNIEGGTPAPDAYVMARWQTPGARWWVEPYAHFAWTQTHLSSLDLGDRRTGAGRTRASIRAFFLNGARVRGWIGPGADNAPGTADDVLIATGETLAEIQDRVLGVGVNSSSLFTEVPGYATAGVRAGIIAGRHQVTVHFENLSDKNYRGIGWGVDAPGRGVAVRYLVRF